MVNEQLVAEGYAQATPYPPDVKYENKFAELEAEAREATRGLWSDICVTASPEPTLVSTSTPQPTATAEPTPTPIPTTVPPPAAAPQQTAGDCNVKGNIASDGEKIFHVPGCASYNATKISPSKGERWFCSEQEALNAGWRKALNC